MWKMIRHLRCSVFNRKILEISAVKGDSGKRLFLSEAYRCQEAWERRLETPILQNMRLDEFYQDLDARFNCEGKASAIDVDLFANKVDNEAYIEELEDILYKLRLCPNTTDTLPSTHHSVIRSYLDFGKHNELLRVLDDRLNFGIFPDDYCTALLMDTFLKEKNYTGATRVSVLQMLQEDWTHRIVSHLALYSCYMYLKNPVPWTDPSEAEKPEDDGEEIKVRVKYLRNPYFDDHFDLRDAKLLVGKTLAMLGKTFPDVLGNTYQLIGWGMYQKWEKTLTLLEDIFKQKEKPSLFKEGVEIFRDILKDGEGAGLDSELRNGVCKLLQEVEHSGLITNDEMYEFINKKVESVVASEEKQMIEEQCKLYSDWQLLRENLLNQQLNELTRKQRLAKIKEEKEKLQKSEEVIFFFDNEENLELAIEKKEQEISKQKFDKKNLPKDQVEDYIPPDVKTVKS